MYTAGYSGTPLAKKLGLKEGFLISVIGAPEGYFDLFDDMPAGVKNVPLEKGKKNFIHYFVTKEMQLVKDIWKLKNAIEQNGSIWISWPKKASKVPTAITEDIIRRIALQNGLVDVKVCAVNEVWSGLKLVIPAKDRNRDAEAG